MACFFDNAKAKKSFEIIGNGALAILGSTGIEEECLSDSVRGECPLRPLVTFFCHDTNEYGRWLPMVSTMLNKE